MIINYFREKLLAKTLKREIRSLPPILSAGRDKAEENWLSTRNNIRSLVLDNFIKTFYDWDLLKYYFIVGDNEYLKKEFESLANSPNFSRYQKALPDSNYIKLHSSQYCPDSNPTRVHHAYHLQQFEDATSLKINDFDFIFEFGGGYGNLNHYIRSLNYKGVYMIYDCEELICLQKYYLKNAGLSFTIINDPDQKIELRKNYGISDIDLLDRMNVNFNTALFIGTWSISETSMGFRNEFFQRKLIKRFQNYLFAFQENFCGVNNISYFDEWLSQNNFNNYIYKTITHLSEFLNHYLFVTPQKIKEN